MATLLCVHGNLSPLLPGYGHVAGSWSVMEAEGMVLQAGPEKSPTIDPPPASGWKERMLRPSGSGQQTTARSSCVLP